MDTDSVVHSVDRVAAPSDDIAPLRPGMALEFVGARSWVVSDGTEVVARYEWDELRFSISWKAYCFADEAERAAWKTHADDLDLDWTMARLVDDLRARGRIDGEVPPNSGLALMIIDEYIDFPAPAPA